MLCRANGETCPCICCSFPRLVNNRHWAGGGGGRILFTSSQHTTNPKVSWGHSENQANHPTAHDGHRALQAEKSARSTDTNGFFVYYTLAPHIRSPDRILACPGSARDTSRRTSAPTCSRSSTPSPPGRRNHREPAVHHNRRRMPRA